MAPRDTMLPPRPGDAFDFELSRETTARPEDVWEVLTNVLGWPRWNGALEAAVLDGDVEHGARGRVAHGGAVAPVEIELEHVRERCSLDVVWVLGPLVRTRTVFRVAAAPGGAIVTVAYQTRGYVPTAHFLTAAGALWRAPECLARLVFLAEERSAMSADLTVRRRRPRAA